MAIPPPDPPRHPQLPGSDSQSKPESSDKRRSIAVPNLPKLVCSFTSPSRESAKRAKTSHSRPASRSTGPNCTASTSSTTDNHYIHRTSISRVFLRPSDLQAPSAAEIPEILTLEPTGDYHSHVTQRGALMNWYFARGVYETLTTFNLWGTPVLLITPKCREYIHAIPVDVINPVLQEKHKLSLVFENQGPASPSTIFRRLHFSKHADVHVDKIVEFANKYKASGKSKYGVLSADRTVVARELETGMQTMLLHYGVVAVAKELGMRSCVDFAAHKFETSYKQVMRKERERNEGGEESESEGEDGGKGGDEGKGVDEGKSAATGAGAGEGSSSSVKTSKKRKRGEERDENSYQVQLIRFEKMKLEIKGSDEHSIDKVLLALWEKELARLVARLTAREGPEAAAEVVSAGLATIAQQHKDDGDGDGDGEIIEESNTKDNDDDHASRAIAGYPLTQVNIPLMTLRPQRDAHSNNHTVPSLENHALLLTNTEMVAAPAPALQEQRDLNSQPTQQTKVEFDELYDDDDDDEDDGYSSESSEEL